MTVAPVTLNRRVEVRQTINREFSSVAEFIAEYDSDISPGMGDVFTELSSSTRLLLERILARR